MSGTNRKPRKWRGARNALISIVAMLAILGLVAPSASAWSLSYIHKVAKPVDGSDNCGSFGATTANIEVEAYNVRQTDGSISRVYKIDMDGDVRSSMPDLVTARVEIDGVRQSATNNFTVKFANQDKRRDVRGTWYLWGCSPWVTLHDM